MYEVKIDNPVALLIEESDVVDPELFAKIVGLEKEGDEDEEVAPENVALPLPTPMQMVQEIIELQQKEVSSVEMVKVLTQSITSSVIHMRQKGILELKWEMELPRLKGVEILLRHYDTAPDSFHIEIIASPEAQELLQKNLPLLETRLTSTLGRMECRFTPVSVGYRKKRKNVVESHRLVYSPE
jgi:hypothetical protein